MVGVSMVPSLDLLVVSHACVRPVNQSVYEELQRRGVSLRVIVPSMWEDEYSNGSFPSRAMPGMEQTICRVGVLGTGSPQRHVYKINVLRKLRRWRPRLLLVEEEAFSFPALQWGLAATSLGIAFGLQADENMDRSLPLPVRRYRKFLLGRAALVAARSPAAADRAREWGALGEVQVIPHAVPEWSVVATREAKPFTVGYAGRLVPEKGLLDLAAAVKSIGMKWRLLLVGSGPQRNELNSYGSFVETRSDYSHDRMPEAFAEMDVLVLPSRTTPTWTEQFGRVLVEALWCGIPVVGADSGEIPWVIATTGGGIVYPEGDVGALATALKRLESDPELRAQLAARGRRAVQERFSVQAVAGTYEEILSRFRSLDTR
jgi:glycosyltransferase involved in cell wall biosynthesis